MSLGAFLVLCYLLNNGLPPPYTEYSSCYLLHTALGSVSQQQPGYYVFQFLQLPGALAQRCPANRFAAGAQGSNPRLQDATALELPPAKAYLGTSFPHSLLCPHSPTCTWQVLPSNETAAPQGQPISMYKSICLH